MKRSRKRPGTLGTPVPHYRCRSTSLSCALPAVDIRTTDLGHCLTETPNSVPTEAYYHCSAEWHLSRLKDSKDRKAPFAAILYPFAYRLSKKSGRFHCSAVRLAGHFGVSKWTIIRAMEALILAGFFVVISKELFQSTTYRVVSHKDWAKDHPGACAVKAAFPWSDESGDELGVRLHTASGGRTKWHPNLLASLRKTGLSDDQIVTRFDAFVRQEIERHQAEGRHGGWKSVPLKFAKYLKDEFFPSEEPEWSKRLQRIKEEQLSKRLP